MTLRVTTGILKKAGRRIWSLGLPGLVVLASGCRTYEQSSCGMKDAFVVGNYGLAAQQVAGRATNKPRSKDYVVWRLEEAAALRAAGEFDASIDAFSKAHDAMQWHAEKAKVRVTREAGALLTNQANLPYPGRLYDGIMLNVYQALNFIEKGDFAAARVHLIRSYECQKDAVHERQRQIDKAQADVEKNEQKEMIHQSRDDAGFKDKISAAYAQVNAVQGYADYVNPFAVYLDGLFFMARAADSSDLERARVSFGRVLGFAAQNDYVKQDLTTLGSISTCSALDPAVYVIFETGCAPYRDQIRIDIPIIISNVSYVGAAFPKLAFVEDYVPRLDIVTGGTTASTQLVASMDSVVAQDFKDQLPVVISKTVAATVVKAAAAYAVNRKAAERGTAAKWIARAATAAYQMAVNIADLRTWSTLPKQFQVCRLPMPADRTLTLRTPDCARCEEVVLGAGDIMVVYVKSPSRGAPLSVRQMRLK